MPNEIRVGLIGCNRRALWYGAIFDDIDPDVYARVDPAAYHHFTYCYNRALLHRRATGFRLAKVYDPDDEAAGRTADAFRTCPEPVGSLEEVSADVDLVFIANESGDGGNHLALATPGLMAGVATFIDRPLAATLTDARAILAVAANHHTPLLSCSHMRMLPHATRFKRRFDEVEPIEFGVVHGHGPNPAAIADGIELTTFLFGDDFGGRATEVRSAGVWPLELINLRYLDPQTGRRLEAISMNSLSGTPRNAFFAHAMGLMTPIYGDNMDAFAQTEGGVEVMMAIKRMIQTGKTPLSQGEMIEPVAVTEGGRRSHNSPADLDMSDFH